MTLAQLCPWRTYTAAGLPSVRYASEARAEAKARQIGGTYKYEPRS